jgi:phosphoribosylamine---glycine ligase
MKVLVVGRGGREHAICQKVSESPLVEKVFVAPGNPGMINCATPVAIDESNHEELVQFAKDENIGLTIIGPEAPLLAGVSDQFRAAGLNVFGPSQLAAEIEGSKSFAKDLMKKYKIPTAKYGVFTDYESAKAFVLKKGAPIVLKADGLASGKGVIVATTLQSALSALENYFINHKFGNAASKVVIEEFLEGEEFSLMALVNGTTVLPLEIAQDHKRAFDGDQGPNTGGMGAYSPVPFISDDIVQTAIRTVLQPVTEALKQEGRSFTGILYAGLIQTNEGPKVIEFNARFGDPETQVVLPRMKSDLVEVILRLLNGETPSIEWSKEAMLGVVIAASGYPENYEKGFALTGLENVTEPVKVFHAGTSLNEEGKYIANGGRLFLTAVKAPSLEEAQEKVYDELKKYSWNKTFYRKDIGYKAVNRVYS